MKDGAEPRRSLGDLLQELVNRVSHRGGKVLAVMNEAAVTLQQVLLMSRLAEGGASTPSELAAALNMSLPSISQMIDRLHQLKLVTRDEGAEDRRRKYIALTRSGQTLFDRIYRARSAEYETGVAQLSKPMRADLTSVLERALQELAASADRS